MEDIKKKSRWITPGKAVVHITNLEQILTVDHVIYVSKSFETEKGSVRKSRIQGVKVKWIDKDGNLQTAIHHTKELIPQEVASKGVMEAVKFVNKEEPYKNY